MSGIKMRDGGTRKVWRLMALRACRVGALTAMILVLAACAKAQTGNAKRGPRVKVADEIFPFGYVPQRALVSHVFWLRNTGDQALEIRKLIPNCGCTEAPLEKKHAAPGDSIRVEIAFGSGLYHGNVEKFVQIESNAAGRVPALTYRSMVVTDSESTGPISLTPRVVNLDSQRPDSVTGGWHTAVTLRNRSQGPLAINIVDRPDRLVVCDDFSGSLGPGEERQIQLRFEPSLPKQTISKSVTFEAIGTDTTRITLPINQRGPWGATPGTAGAKPK